MVLLQVFGTALLLAVVDCATLGRIFNNLEVIEADGKCKPNASVCHFSYMSEYSGVLKAHNTYIPEDWYKCNETENCRPRITKRWTHRQVYSQNRLCGVWERCKQHQGLQSPIDVETDEAEYKNFKPQYINAREVIGNFTNNGHSPTFTVEGKGADNQHAVVMRGVPGRENTDYVFYELHFHIGTEQDEGSEHSIDDKFYPGEIHMVHWKRDSRTTSPSQAEEAKDGLMAVGVFFTVDETPSGNSYIDDLIQGHVANIQNLYQCENAFVDPNKVLPKGGCIYSYRGSKTTPPCMETVVFLLYSEPVKISKKSYEILAKVNTSDGPRGRALLSEYGNRRPIQDRDVDDLIHNCCASGVNCRMEELVEEEETI